jgi:hypothetical protein
MIYYYSRELKEKVRAKKNDLFPSRGRVIRIPGTATA